MLKTLPAIRQMAILKVVGDPRDFYQTYLTALGTTLNSTLGKGSKNKLASSKMRKLKSLQAEKLTN